MASNYVQPGGLPNKGMLSGDPTVISPAERANADLLMKGRVSPEWRDGFSGDVQRKLQGINEASKEIKPQGLANSPSQGGSDLSNVKVNAPGMANEPGYSRGGSVTARGRETLAKLQRRHGGSV